jgi:ABC-2 type transport system permease protein
VSAVTPFVPKLDAPGRVTFSRVLLSEWTKFRTVRSTKWCLGVATFLVVAVPLIPAFVALHHWHAGESIDISPLDIALPGIQIAQLAIGVLGVLTITSEYSTGSIRSTFTAVPKRLPVLWAKLVDFALVSRGLLVPAILVSFFETQAIVRDIPGLQLSLGTSSIARCVLMAPVYVMLVGVFTLALGAIIRNTAGGIVTFVALFFVLPPLAHILPGNWETTTLKYLPLNAGEQMFSLTHGSDSLSPLGGSVVMLVYCAVAIVIAAVLLQRRDV